MGVFFVENTTKLIDGLQSQFLIEFNRKPLFLIYKKNKNEEKHWGMWFSLWAHPQESKNGSYHAGNASGDLPLCRYCSMAINSFNAWVMLWDSNYYHPYFTNKDIETKLLKLLSKDIKLLNSRTGAGVKSMLWEHPSWDVVLASTVHCAVLPWPPPLLPLSTGHQPTSLHHSFQIPNWGIDISDPCCLSGAWEASILPLMVRLMQ